MNLLNSLRDVSYRYISSSKEDVQPQEIPRSVPSLEDQGYIKFFNKVESEVPTIPSSPVPGQRRSLYPMDRETVKFLTTFKSIAPKSSKDFEKCITGAIGGACSSKDLFSHDLTKKFGFPIRVLGQGSFGDVYLFQTAEGKHTAVKFVEIENDQLLVTLAREYINSRKLSGVYACRCLDILVSTSNRSQIILVQEYFNGRELFALLNMKGSSLARVRLGNFIFKRIFAAIQHCHENGVCHNDLKTENILVNMSSLQIRVIDFGLSLSTSTPMTNKSKHECLTWGTSGYVAPISYAGDELFSEYMDDYDLTRLAEAKDIWALGCIFFNIISFGSDLWEECVPEDFYFQHYVAHGQLLAFDQIKGKLMQGNYLENIEWVLRGMVKINEKERLSFEQIADSDWYNEEYRD